MSPSAGRANGAALANKGLCEEGQCHLMAAMRNATLADIAKEAAVAVSTASIVLSKAKQYDEIPEATRERIHAAAQKLKYLPMMGSRQLKRRRSGTIALLLSAEPDRSFLNTDLLYGISGELLKHDLSLSFVRLDDKSLTGTLPRFLRQKEVDGVLINYNIHMPRQLIDRIHHYEIPAVLLNTREAEGDMVYFDHYHASQGVVRRLTALGHRRIWFLNYSGQYDHYSLLDTMAGYQDAMRQAGLEPQVLDTPVPRADRLNACMELLAATARGEGATAIFALYMSSAIPVIQAAAALGLAIPGKLSLCTIGDQVQTSIVNPQPDHISMPWEEAARVSVQMLLNRIEKKTAGQKISRCLECQWVEGAGTIGSAG